jgi:hypothetical protein
MASGFRHRSSFFRYRSAETLEYIDAIQSFVRMVNQYPRKERLAARHDIFRETFASLIVYCVEGAGTVTRNHYPGHSSSITVPGPKRRRA